MIWRVLLSWTSSTYERVSPLSSGQARLSIHPQWALDDITRRCPSSQNLSKQEKVKTAVGLPRQPTSSIKCKLSDNTWSEREKISVDCWGAVVICAASIRNQTRSTEERLPEKWKQAKRTHLMLLPTSAKYIQTTRLSWELRVRFPVTTPWNPTWGFHEAFLMFHQLPTNNMQVLISGAGYE